MGKEAEPRKDIFAFGAVLYESATGRKAFEGKSQASLIGSILRDEPALVDVPIRGLVYEVETGRLRRVA